MEDQYANLLEMAGNASGTIGNAVSVVGGLTKLAKSNKLPPEVEEKIRTLSG